MGKQAVCAIGSRFCTVHIMYAYNSRHQVACHDKLGHAWLGGAHAIASAVVAATRVLAVSRFVRTTRGVGALVQICGMMSGSEAWRPNLPPPSKRRAGL